jgi:S1-C subfamily serine protease
MTIDSPEPAWQPPANTSDVPARIKDERRPSGRLALAIAAVALAVSVVALSSSRDETVVTGVEAGGSESYFSAPPDLGLFVETISESIVLVECDGWGTGFAFYTGEDSPYSDLPTQVITNYHVIEDCLNDETRIRVSVGPNHEKLTRSKVVGTDQENDLAIIAIEAEIPLLESAQEFAEPGWWTMAIGNPVDTDFEEPRVLHNSTTFGQISYVLDEYWNYTSATINGGNSGGPLLNSRGEVIGINTLAAASTEDGVWNIAIDTAALCEQLISNCTED